MSLESWTITYITIDVMRPCVDHYIVEFYVTSNRTTLARLKYYQMIHSFQTLKETLLPTSYSNLMFKIFSILCINLVHKYTHIKELLCLRNNKLMVELDSEIETSTD